MFIISFSLLWLVSTVAGVVVNTTQFDNFTIEWEDFSLFSCGAPTVINVSIFTCASSIGYKQVDDIDCLESTTIDFNQSTCGFSNGTAVYPTTIMATTKQVTTAGIQTAAMTTGGTTVGTNTASGGGTTTTSTTTSGTSINSAATSATNVNSIATGATSSNPTTAGATSVNPATTGATSGNSVATSGTSAASIGNPTSTSAATGGTNVVPISSTVMTTAVSTTYAPSNIYYCPSADYIGISCNTSADACAMSQPCRNAATCYPNNTLPYGYYCNCQQGYTGYNCEYDRRVCKENTCWHNGTCVPMNGIVATNNGSNFTCECVEGYDGRYCELEVNLCVNVTCQNRGVCSSFDHVWKCNCLDSSLYYGDHCEYKTTRLQIREILSKSFASVAIGAIVTTCGFVIIMDILKYAFNIDPVLGERESYRKRREELKRARRPIRQQGPRFALRFKYIS